MLKIKKIVFKNATKENLPSLTYMANVDIQSIFIKGITKAISIAATTSPLSP